MRRILHVLGTSRAGGTERFLIELLRHHAGTFDSAIGVLDDPGPLEPEYRAVASRVVHFGRATWSPGAIRGWRALARDWAPDVIVLYGTRANLLGRTMPAGPRRPALISALRSVAVDDRGGRIAPIADRITFGRLAACVSNSRAALQGLLDRGYPAERLSYIPPAVDPERFSTPTRDEARRSLGIPGTGLVLVSVANLKPVKNHAVLLHASQELSRAGIAHRLYLVGTGPERAALEALARDLGIDAHVVFAGFQSDPRPYYAAADLFLLASRWEGSPTSLLEAAAHGVPAIATGAGDIPWIVRDGVDGRVLRPGTAGQFARAIREWHGDASVRTRWRAETLVRAASAGSVRAMADRYAALFEWAAAGGGLPVPHAFEAPGRPMRIVRVLSRLNVGGPAIHVTLLTRYMNDARHATELVSGSVGRDEGDMAYLGEALGVEVRTIPALGRSVHPARDLAALAQLVRLLLRTRPDVVHTHASKAGTLGRIAAALYNLTRRRARRAVILHTYHGHTFEGYFGPAAAWTFRTIERVLARITDRIVVLSTRQQRDIAERFRIAPADRTVVVPLGLDLTALFDIDDRHRCAARTALGLADGTPLLLSPGRLTAIKDHRLLLAAFARLPASDHPAELMLAGDGELRQALESQAAELGIAHRVRFAGWVRDMAPLYAAADVVSLASRNEGTPVALIEALAAGCPIVATRVGGVPDVVDESCGILVPAGDVNAFAAALAHQLSRGRLPRSCRDHARRFSIERLVTDLSSMYRALLDARVRSASP